MRQALDHPFPWWLSFILYNPLRRRLDPPSKVVGILGVKRKHVVVDFGCGPGFYTISFANVARRVVAIDLQRKMLEKAAKNARKNRVKVDLVRNAERGISLKDASADLVFLSGVFHELDYKPTVLREARRVLKLNGRLAIKEKTRDSLSPLGPPIMKVSEITKQIQEAGMQILDKISVGNDTVIVAAKDH